LLLIVGGFAPAPVARADVGSDSVPVGSGDSQISSVAWGDWDGDGDLDLAVGNHGQANQVYQNNGTGGLILQWESVGDEKPTTSVAWGDWDGDGDLDLAVGNNGDANQVYANTGGMLNLVWESTNDASDTTSVAWSDWDNDGDLDLGVGNYNQPNQVFENDGGTLILNTAQGYGWQSDTGKKTTSIAWGDWDGDGDQDLAMGNDRQRNYVYENDGGTLILDPDQGWGWQSEGQGQRKKTSSVAWGDWDGDGDLDLAVGNTNQHNQVYENDQGDLLFDPNQGYGWKSSRPRMNTRSVAWGDWDGDGDLDLAFGNYHDANQIYENDQGTLTEAWQSDDSHGPTTSVAWGDWDNDGDLDLVVGNEQDAPQVHLNDGNTLATAWSEEVQSTSSIAWGDWDGDGDLDLAVGRGAAGSPQTNHLYTNDNGSLSLAWISTGDARDTRSVAWGDWDGDGDQDLAVGNVGQPNQVYAADNGNLTMVWESTGDIKATHSVAWGDWDGDGDLDLAVGNYGDVNQVYQNNGAEMSLAWESTGDSRNTTSIAWGDWDNDGDLDLAVGNDGQPNQVYANTGGSMSMAWEAPLAQDTRSIAWGDWNGDGHSDLAVGNYDQPNQVFVNDGATLSQGWESSDDVYRTTSVAWGDWNGDGDLDLAVGNEGQANQVYTFANGNATVLWEPVGEAQDTSSMAWGDWDNDGDLDLAAGTGGTTAGSVNQVYENPQAGGARLGNTSTTVSISRPDGTADASFYSTAEQLHTMTIPIAYTLSDNEHNAVSRVQGFYSLDGGGQWFPAIPTVDTETTNLASGVEHVYTWDVYDSGFFGSSDNVVFRLDVMSMSGPFQHAMQSALSPSFRIRGSQIRVLNEDEQPMGGAQVYRLQGDQEMGGTPLSDETNQPLITDAQGYLQGRVQVNVGDRLFAMAPITHTDSYTMYHTSGTPTEIGVDTFDVTTPGVQEITVADDNVLILFNLTVSLEWDASNDPTYLQQLEFNLQRTSQYLYDFTNGQIALGEVTVSQNADDWAYSHIVVHATNNLRPFASQGGIVITPTLDPQHDDIVYDIGQVAMGSTWNRYGDPGYNLADDWPIILAHELGHYLLFQDDVYLGINDDGILISVDTCTGSAMGDPYSDMNNTEFIADDGFWNTNCTETLANRTLERNEWETLSLWYPWLTSPDSINPGPSIMPFNFTDIHIYDPLTPTNALEDPTFYLDYTDRVIGSSEARAYIVRDEYVVDMGNPIGGQNRVLARGAQPGDTLCVFDRGRQQYGCEVIELGDDRLSLEVDPSWDPFIQITPVNSTTLNIQVEQVPSGLPMHARLYPEYGWGEEPVVLNETNGVYSGTFTLTDVAMAGNIRVWIDETATESNPRRETILAYSIGGNPGGRRSRKGDQLDGYGGRRSRKADYLRGDGGRRSRKADELIGYGGRRSRKAEYLRVDTGGRRSRRTSLLSPDGQMFFYTENPLLFEEGDFYTIQDMAGLPALPPGRTVVGKGYNLVATPNAPLMEGSISFEYMGNDVIAAGADEETLTIYHWDGTVWTALHTVRDPYYNVASARSNGPGVYVLMSSVEIPLEAEGWNLVAYPVKQTRAVTVALQSIDGYYTQVYGYEPTDTADPWKLYDATMPTMFGPSVNDLHELRFGKGYFINATRAVTLLLKHDPGPGNPGLSSLAELDEEGEIDLASLPQRAPTTYYGAVEGDDTFTPAPDMLVVARVNDVVCGEGYTREVDGQVIYVVDVWADEPGMAEGCGAPGRTVTFQVGEHMLATTAAWDNSQSWELTLQSEQQQQLVYLPLLMR
jgi:hypothetical protein